jgi:hypothetical protein
MLIDSGFVTSSFRVSGSYAQTGNAVITGSLNVTAGITGSLFGTSSHAVTASFFGGSISTAVSASYASSSTSASYAVNAGTAQSASFATNANSASYALNAGNTQTASFATNANSASYALNAGSAQSASFATNAANAFIQNGNSFGAQAVLGTNDAQNLAFETNGTVRMTITGSDGNVGIGTITPSAKLDVSGSIRVIGNIARNTVLQTNTDNHLVLTTTNTAGDVYTTFENSGDANNAWAVGRGNDGTFRINYSTGATYPSGTTTSKIFIDANGNVGIGTTTPGALLHVSGNVSASSFTGSLLGTASFATNATSASYASSSTSASFATNAVTAQTASFFSGTVTSASYALNAGNTQTASFATNANSASYALNAGNTQTASFATTARSASYATNAGTTISSSFSTNAGSASYATNAGNAQSSSFASTASSADNFTVRNTLTATTIVVQTITSSVSFITGSTRFGILASNTHVFTGSVSISGSLTVQGAISGSNITGSLLGTASYANNALSSSYAVNAGNTQTASFATNANSASYAVNAGSAQSASFATNAANAFIQNGNSFGAAALLGTNDAQNLQFETNGTVRMTISSSGNVGIGTATPTEGKLVIANSGPSVIYNKETSQGINSFWNSSDGAVVQFGAASNHPLLLFTNNTEKVRILSNGNVGIDQTSPASKLDVNGIIFAGSNSSTEGTIILQDQYSSGHLTNFGTNRSSGGVVIGYGVIPSAGTTNAFSSSTAIALERAAFSFDGSFRWYTGAAQTVNTGSAATLTQRMVLDNNGNVGIGTTTPSFPLSFGTALGNKIAIYDAGSGTGYGFGIQSGLLQIFANAVGDRVGIGYGNSTSFTETLSIKGANVGIGTTAPAVALDVVGRMILKTATAGLYVYTSGSSFADGIRIGDISTDNGFMYLAYVSESKYGSIQPGDNSTYRNLNLNHQGGNVGIGFLNPTGKLHISSSTSINHALRIEAEAASDTFPVVYIEGNKSGGSPAVATLIELRSNADVRGRGIHMTTGGSNNKWFAGVPYLAGGYQIGYDGSANALPFYAQSSSLFINTNGNVGIGTTTPTTKLDINGTIALAGLSFARNSGNHHQLFEPAGGIALYLGNATDPGNYYDNTTHNFRNRGGGTTYAIINSAGNVGIGITAPTGALHAYGNANAGVSIRVENGNIGASAFSTIQLGQSIGTSPTAVDRWLNIGYSSVGVPASGPFTSTGSFIINYGNGGLSLATTGSNAGTSHIKFFTSGGAYGTERMRIEEAGNVGIGLGSTAASAKFHVSGTIKTDQPLGGTTVADTYRWGSVVVTTGLTLLTTRYVEVDIGGTIRKVGLVA